MTATVPPEMVVDPVETSLSFWPAGLMATAKVEPAAKEASPVTVNVAYGASTPGATVAPLLATSPPIVPVPPSVAPISTVTGAEGIEPSTSNVPSLTLTGKASALVPVKFQVDLSILFKASKS